MAAVVPESSSIDLPLDYVERVYAGVLGKIIGVYLGRPFEGWGHRQILSELGEIDYYVHEARGVPLVVTDDDISGTFTFLRALEDYGYDPNLTPAQIGQTWLNYIIENRTILWWGGMGLSTEHTAFLRLKRGMQAPESGSMATNGKVVAEQIGSQIFIDGWGMICPGDPVRAADFARRAASVSHDGEAIYGAQVVAAIVAQAFVESDIDRLLDTGLAQIPEDSVIARLIRDIRRWHAEGLDWKEGFLRIEAEYGYDKFGGNCHMVPNHALIVHALLHGGGDFSRSLMIVNTCGWDTDCNSGNVGCILGVRNGLAGIEDGPDWRGPVADRMFLPTADGGRAVTDAVQESVRIVNAAQALRGGAPLSFKGGARFHFELPGSVQGFRCSDEPSCRDVAEIENVTAESEEGTRTLAIHYDRLATGRMVRVATATFINAEAKQMGGYGLIASPTLYPGQTVRARVVADRENAAPVNVSLYVGCYGKDDAIHALSGEGAVLEPGDSAILEWTVPDTEGYPIAEVGLEATSERRVEGSLFLDYLTWDGVPATTFWQTSGGKMWRQAWVNGVTHFMEWGEPFRMAQDEGTGLLITGTRDWTDLRVTSTVVPHLVSRGGVAARVQGMRRWYGLLLYRDGFVRLVKSLDGERVLAETPFAWELGDAHELSLEVVGSKLVGRVNGQVVIEAIDEDRPLDGGGIALVLTEGRMATDSVRVEPAG